MFRLLLNIVAVPLYLFPSLTNAQEVPKGSSCCSYPVNAVAINPKLKYGGEIASAQGCVVHLWDMGMNFQIKANKLEGHSDDVTSLDFNLSLDLLATASKDRTVKIWDLILRKEKFTLRDHNHWVLQVAFSNNGKILASCGKDGQVITWDVATGKMLKRYQAKTSVNAIAFDSSASLLAFGSADGSIRVVDAYDFTVKAEYNIHNEPVHALLFRPGSNTVISGGNDKLIRQYDYAAGTEGPSLQGHILPVTSLRIKNDNNQLQLISASEDETIRTWDLASGKPQMLMQQTGKVLALATAPGYSHPFSDLLLSASEDKQIRFWKRADEREVASLYFTTDGSPILRDKVGYFFSSARLLSTAHLYSAANENVPEEYLELQYNRPDIVLQRLGIYTEEAKLFEKAYNKRLLKTGIDTTVFSFRIVPTISIREMPAANSAGKQIPLQITATDSASMLSEIVVKINGVPVVFSTGRTHRYDTEKSISLSNGKNEISVYAVNEKGLRSKQLKYEVFHTGERSPENLHLVSIGASMYNDAIYNLKLAATDALKMVNVMKQQSRFKNIFTYVLTDTMVTRANILALKQKLALSAPDDVVIFFFAGQGVIANDFTYYMGTFDMDLKDPAKPGFSNEDLLGFFHDITARRRVALIDACHSGEMAEIEQPKTEIPVMTRGVKPTSKKAMPTPYEIMQFYFRPVENPEGILRLSASSSSEFSFEKDETNGGVFTYAVINALRDPKTDTDNNDEISFAELSEKVKREVSTLTNNKQHPEANAGPLGNVSLFASGQNKDTRPPIIDIKEPAIKGRATIVQTKTGAAMVRGYAIDESEIKYITVNDQKAIVKEGGMFEATINLKEGENNVAVVAEDIYGNKQDRQVVMLGKETAISNVGKYYGLFIGVNHYKDESLNLEYPVGDARQLQSVLMQQYNFDSANIIFLENPTRAGIFQAFNKLKSLVTEIDNVLIFYAGHGQWKKDEGQGYWLASDAVRENDESNWISNDDVTSKIKALKAKHVLLIADACFSGKLLYKSRAVMDSASTSVAETYNMKSRRVISSGALETVPDKSIFIEFLCDYLRTSKDKFLYSKRLYIGIKDDVTERSPSRQRPLDGPLIDTGDENGDFIFIRR